MMGMLTGNQKQAVGMFQKKSDIEKAEEIARICNEKGIDKEQLQSIMNMLKR